ncbi:MAG: flippase, partial [Chloroflexi bacterium]|nr:flippase [Chloroflexota bacterium]
EKTLNANTPMIYGLSDIRGYDSIIPRQYVETMSVISEQSELPYNRIAPLFAHRTDALDAPLLDAMNVKYVVTARERSIDNAGYALVYDGEVRIYRNEGALPRAWIVPQAVTIADAEERRQALGSFDPRSVVILEETPGLAQVDAAALSTIGQAEVLEYTPNQFSVAVEARIPCFLVLSDSYDSDWLAYIRPADAADPQGEEQSLQLYRANGNARAVEVPPGDWVVRFKYSPDSVKYGLYVSFVAGMTLLLAGALWVWLRRFKRVQEAGDAQRVTRNTLAPITLTLVNKLLDMAFAMLMLRVLSPAEAGQYYFAVLVISWFDILTSFGLNALMTRDIARDRTQANRYLTNAIILRTALCALSVPTLALFVLGRGLTNPIEPRTVVAIALFGLALLPSNVSASYSAVFSAYERMELPAAVTTLSTLLKVAFGTLALGLGTGFVGLGVVSIVVSLITAVVLNALLRRTLFRPRFELDAALQRTMLRDSWPLMLNNLLATLFFKVAVQLLDVEALVPDKRVLGYYSTAYKYIDAVNIIPSSFTLAIFPLMARYATGAKGSLLRAYRLAIKLLLVVALPSALVGWAAAGPLIQILGGSRYLPQGGQLLKVMVWYMPIGF